MQRGLSFNAMRAAVMLARYRVAAMIAVPLLIVAVAVLQSLQFAEADRLRQQVEQVYAARAVIARTLSLHQDVETGQRGYLLTGDESFLAPYERARAALPGTLRALDGVLAGDPALAATLAELHRLDAAKLAFVGRAIALRRTGRDDAAMALIAEGEGKRIMDAIRRAIGRMDRLYVDRLTATLTAAAQSRARLRELTYLLEAMLLLVLALAAWLVSLSLGAKRQALDRLGAFSARQAAIFDAVSDGMITHDRDGRILSLNPAAARLYGYAARDLVGRNVAMLFADPPPPDALRDFLTALAARGTSAERVQEFAARRADGGTFITDVTTSLVDAGEDSYFVAVIRDVTQRRQMETMKDEFVATVSHELRTPLTSIAGSLGLLGAGAAGGLPEPAAKLIAIARANCERLMRLVDDILDSERMGSGTMRIERVPLALADLVRQAIAANTGFAAAQGVTLRLVEADGMDALRVLGDADRLIQVVTNLLSNAAKFAPAHSDVTVTLAAGDTHHRITVADTGPGVPDEFRERIFGRFAQADASDRRRTGGTGLGLSIVKQIVDRMGGRVGFDSVPGDTRFYVELPRADADGGNTA